MELIDKDALIAEIEKRLHANGAFDEVGDEAWAEDVGMCNAYKSILSFINTLEVKEVDLEEELSNYIKHYRNKETGYTMLGIAEHFFELGLKTKKGE